VPSAYVVNCQCARLDSLLYRDGFGGLCLLWNVSDEES
jgi:hypothetical protein